MVTFLLVGSSMAARQLRGQASQENLASKTDFHAKSTYAKS